MRRRTRDLFGYRARMTFTTVVFLVQFSSVTEFMFHAVKYRNIEALYVVV